MQDDQTFAAIDAALKCDWQKAVVENCKILENCPNDVDCLNRLGKAYMELGNNKKALLYFKNVLKTDKYNPIALKNIDKLNNSGKSSSAHPSQSHTSPSQMTANFLEEPGKTRLVNLVNIASATILLKQDYADCLKLLPKRHTVVVEDMNGNYLGALPDDLGHRLSILIKGGNQYTATAKSICKNQIVIFLREMSRCKKFKDTPSFLNTNAPDYLSYLREDSAAPDPAKIASDQDNPDNTDGPEDVSSGSKLHQDEEPEA